ncbi:hypothetical protein K1J32_13175 [Enterobacter kobei]|uniref:hypothetical protein n=1 Tax=Enterobacter kobei TaxID=208224 RepID=UPI001C63E04A|nr:hypothetical protein [Enterobacter kobei]MBW7591655.1 hypothetical protein [Enterobacter kobei]
MFWGVVKLNGELGNRLAEKIRDEIRKARVTQSAAHRWKLVRLQPPHHQNISPASAGNDRTSLKHRVPMLGDGNTAISTAQETMILFWLDWKSLLCPPARGHFFGGCMFATDISLKYGTHQPETILETMPIEEASEIIKEKLRDEVRQELECEYGDRLYEAEEEASNWESRADDYESDATCLAKAIREAFESASFEDAKVILQRAMHDHKDYF